MNDTILDEIQRRLYAKRAESYLKIKSITLGINIWDELQAEIHRNPLIQPYYINNGYGDKQIFGYPIKIAYKRKNLIQINLEKPIRKRMDWNKPTYWPIAQIPARMDFSFLTST